jgi:hypothetical protein
LDEGAILFLLQVSLPVADLLLQVASFGQDAIGGPFHMLPSTGPPILLCLLNHTRSDRILLHISHGGIDMPLIQDRGIEPPLPEMTGGSSTTLDILGILHVKQIECAGQGIFVGRHTDEVDMVAHEAIGPDLHRISLAVLFEPFEILQVIDICPKNHLAVVATLGDVVRKSLRYCSCDPGHGRNLVLEVPFVSKNGRYPLYSIRITRVKFLRKLA